MDLIRISDLLKATGGDSVPAGMSGEDPFNRVVIDSREVVEGDVFWALSGESRDGHEFLEDAIGRGAKFCVASRNKTTWYGPAVYVADTFKALGDLAAWYRRQREPLVIGVTGSFGKTTTREMIHAVLGVAHSGISSIGNYNNEIGLPLSLLQLEEHHDYGVLEMGACRPGDIRNLCEIAQPEIGVITGIGPAHLEKFGTVADVVRTKAELVQALPAHGFAVINGDDEYAHEIAGYADCKVIFAGEFEHNDIRATNVVAGRHRLSFEVDRHQFQVPACGRHYLSAALAAVAVGLEVGMPHNEIEIGLSRFATPDGRCQVRQIGRWTIVDDTYNANPASMRAACQLMAAWQTRNKKLAIVGDMLELGSDAPRYHRELGMQVAQSGIDCLLAHGSNAQDVIHGATSAGMKRHQMAQCTVLESLLTNLDCWLEPGDVLLVKGSRSTKMERVIDWAKERAAGEDNSQTVRTTA